MTTLRLADGFELPLQAVTETFAILAKRGSGKTSTAVVLAEEMIGAGQQALIIDPTGVLSVDRTTGLRRGAGLLV